MFHTVMSSQQPNPSFHSIVRLETGITMWTQLEGDDDPLVQLHSKFWGKKLTLEDPEPSGPMDVDDIDFLPGCAILDIGIGDLPFQKIWIRADYMRVYDYIESCEAPTQTVNLLPPAAVVTGQPGIGEFFFCRFETLLTCMRKGKSVWIYYALCRRLVDRKSVIWYRNQACYLFSKEGVFRSPTDFPSTGFRFFVWTLVDSDQSSEGAPPHLLSPGTRLYVIYVTSPRRARWARMNKTVRDVRLIMNPWTKREIDIAWVSFQLLTCLKSLLEHRSLALTAQVPISCTNDLGQYLSCASTTPTTRWIGSHNMKGTFNTQYHAFQPSRSKPYLTMPAILTWISSLTKSVSSAVVFWKM